LPLYTAICYIWYNETTKGRVTITHISVMKRARNILTAIATTLVVASPMIALAQTVPVSNIRDLSGITYLLRTLLQWIYTIFFIIAAIMIIWAAFSYLTAGGDEEKIDTAKKRFIYAIVAVAIAIVATSVSFVVGNLVGITPPPV